MADITAASLDKLSCTKFSDFGKRQNHLHRSSWSNLDSNFLDIMLKVFKKDDNTGFQLAEKHPRLKTYFDHFLGLRNQLILAEENFSGEENL